MLKTVRRVAPLMLVMFLVGAQEVVASPLGRARHTAEIIAECLADAPGRPRPLRFDGRLREISLGSWDGVDKRQIKRHAPELFAGEEAREGMAAFLGRRPPAWAKSDES